MQAPRRNPTFPCDSKIISFQSLRSRLGGGLSPLNTFVKTNDMLSAWSKATSEDILVAFAKAIRMLALSSQPSKFLQRLYPTMEHLVGPFNKSLWFLACLGSRHYQSPSYNNLRPSKASTLYGRSCKLWV